LGTVYPNCSGKFFETLKELVRESPGISGKIRINIVGYPDEVVQRYAEDETLRSLVNIHGFVGHPHSVELMRASYCLLLFWANRDFARSAIAGKTYEYLRSGRPILAITHDGPMKTLIEKGNAGWVIHPDDKQGIKCALRRMIAAPSSLANRDAARIEFAAQFRYDRLASSMAAIFDAILPRQVSADVAPSSASWPESSEIAHSRLTTNH
jgi:glycosyltransferase involved in cell wall biosynthesis